jgi:Zn-dependent M28 family amino/carboxypeptidase
LEAIDTAELEHHVDAVEGWRWNSPFSTRYYLSNTLVGFGYEVETDSALNVIARKAGDTRPESALILGAHYDTVPFSPGADDNASGVAAVLELARVFASVSVGSTLEFVFFAGEEMGLLGSRAYAAAAAAADRNLLGAISLDMIGFTSSGFFPGPIALSRCFVTSNDSLVPHDFVFGVSTSASMLAGFAAAAAAYAPSLPVVTGHVLDGSGNCLSDLRRSDHAPFWDAGYDAMLVNDVGPLRNPNYHQETDTADTLDFAFMTGVTRATAAYAAERVRLVPEPGTTLLLAFAGLAAGARRWQGGA